MSARAAAPVVVLLGLAAAASPRLAHAQPLPAQARVSGRPLAMPDLAPTSSIGVLGDAALVLGLDEPVEVLALRLDADVALGSFAKAFASFPIVAVRGFGDSSVGVGNLALGMLAMTDGASGRVGAGAAVGYGATADGELGVLSHFDEPAFAHGALVAQAFAAARAGDDDAFVQLLVDDAHRDGGDLPGARLGGGVRLAPYWLLGELHGADDFGGTAMVALDLGLRGGFPGPGGQTWCVRAGGAYSQGVTSVTGGIEIRTW